MMRYRQLGGWQMAAADAARGGVGGVLESTHAPAPRDVDYPGLVELHVDASDVGRRIFHAREIIPVTGGRTVWLLYPQWIPGHHSATGPIARVAGLTVRADGGAALTWRRDPYDVFAFAIDVPDGVNALEVEFDFLSAQRSHEGPLRVTPDMLDLSWNKVSLYPAGFAASRIQVQPSLTLPAGWEFGTALTVAHNAGTTVAFEPLDYASLVDSPVYAGRHFKRIDIGSADSPPVAVNIMADAPQQLEVKPESLATLKAIVAEMGKLYGAFHFDHYEFLLALSKHLTRKGLEHHRSSENITAADFFTDWKPGKRRDLLTHEFNHSWNGKYRRGADLATANFNVPMGDTLMWVYEGQTQFYGNVVAVRSGLEDQATGFAKLARVLATYAMNRPGFGIWRNVQDTTNDPSIAQRRPRPWRNWTGGEDYYAGGQLIWLAVDGKLRELSGNQHCLDDFARAFFGMEPGSWRVNTYIESDVYTALDNIEPFDWRGFIRGRLDGQVALTDGLALEGWQLVYAPEPDAGLKAMLAADKDSAGDFTFSIGFSGKLDGNLGDVRWGGPAFKAGLAPGMRIIAVNSREYSAEGMEQALKDAVGNEHPIELLVRSLDQYQTLVVDYHEGPKYPSLVRIDDRPDYLTQLYAPRR